MTETRVVNNEFGRFVSDCAYCPYRVCRYKARAFNFAFICFAFYCFNTAFLFRAVLESITYQMTDLLEAMMKDSGIVLKDLRVDGGASVSDIMMQIQADMTGVNVNRPKNVETTALGAAYCAGLATGVWDSLEEIEANRAVDKIFVPSMEITKRNEKYSDWKRAVERSRNWER